MDFKEASALQLNQTIQRREHSARDIAEYFLARCREYSDTVRPFLTLDEDTVLSQAETLDRGLLSGDLKPTALTGVPVAVKDNISSQGIRTTCGSSILGNYTPVYDAEVIRRLKEAGAIVFGKTNLDEFAMGSSCEHSAFVDTRNPWDLGRVPGGSSGGSAAAVAAQFCPLALGSDTGGSIRQPASFCGVVGLKPTYGRVSRFGLVAFGSSLDQIGPFGKTVRDISHCLQSIAGPDPKDSTSASVAVPTYEKALDKGFSGLKVGVLRDWLDQVEDPEVRQSLDTAIEQIGLLGCELQDVSMPNTKYAIATYYILAPAEASSNLARYEGVRFGQRSQDHGNLETMYRSTRSRGFGKEVKRRIMIGTYVLSSGYYDAYFAKASKVRSLIWQDYQDVFGQVDVLVSPTTPSVAFQRGEKTSPLEMYLSDVFTVTANLAGIPALSMPCGFTSGGLPIGLQLQAGHFQESKLLALANRLEESIKVQRPPFEWEG